MIRRLALWCGFVFVVINRVGAQDAPAPKPTPDAAFGHVRYRTPDRTQWRVAERDGRRDFAADLPAPDFCTLTIFAGGRLEGDFAATVEHAITAELHARHADKIERDTGAQWSQAAEGFDVIQRVLVAATPDFHTCHWFIAAHPGDRWEMVAFQTSSEEMYQRYGQQAADFFYSVKMSDATAALAAAPEGTNAPAVAAAAQATGPLAVGDRVEVPWGGNWVPGVVRHVEGLTYFVHYGTEADAGKYDDFFTLNLLRHPGGPQTFAETFHELVADPTGGPLPLGTAVEFDDGRWLPARIARRLDNDRYIIFADKPGDVTERWLTLDKLRLPGTNQPLANENRFRPRKPTSVADIRIGDVVEAHPRGGFWNELTVLAQAGPSYYVKIGPNSGMSMRGWVGLWQMRPVGTKDPFEPEDLSFFVGRWSLSGDSFQLLVGREVSGSQVTETYQNNSGAGQSAGAVVINADGTYRLMNTFVYHDGKGRWERNPNQDEGGIVLRGADGNGDKDCIITNHQDGFGYLQGAIRGPGKWCTRVAP